VSGSGATSNGDWRRYRPAIWLAMLGVALVLLINPPYIGAALLGASIGVGLRIARRDRLRRRSGGARNRPPGG
jgi:hypothetical protein